MKAKNVGPKVKANRTRLLVMETQRGGMGKGGGWLSANGWLEMGSKLYSAAW